MVGYHKSMLNKLKDSIDGCTHVIHVRDVNDNYFIKFHVENSKGGVDKVSYKLGTHPNNLKESDYNELITKVNNKEYARKSDGVLQDVEG